jgi:hypothetical protein
MNRGFKIDLTGKRYNRYIVKSFAGRVNNRSYWNCICDCGNEKMVESHALKIGHTKSCGCLPKEIPNGLKHGLSAHKIYAVWNSMRGRCNNPKNKAYKNYGARGISVCDRWLCFDLFIEDMLDTYRVGLTLERRDTNGDYEKTNCYWDGRKAQARNRRNNKIVTYRGLCASLAEVCEVFKVDERLIRRRIRDGWQLADAIETPVMYNRINIGKRKGGM